MQPNPYAPPKAAVSDIEPTSATPGFPVRGGLYTPAQHFVAAFIGSPIAAALLAASNYRRLAREREARDILVWGLVATAVIFSIAFVLPDGFPNFVLPLAYSFGVRALADVRFGSAVSANRAAGGESASWGRVIAISILSLIVAFTLLFGVAFGLAYLGVIE